MKKLILIFCFSLLVFACKEKEENTSATEETLLQAVLPDDLEIVYSYQKDSLQETCSSENDIVCTIEKVVKCALNPSQPFCDKKTMPDFIFYDDAMFAEGDVEGRPTKQSFKFIKTKPINNQMVEIYTLGDCDKNWFGACRGNIIYVMSRPNGIWQIDDIYAVETIK